MKITKQKTERLIKKLSPIDNVEFFQANPKYVRVNDFAKANNITVQTVLNKARNGSIEARMFMNLIVVRNKKENIT